MKISIALSQARAHLASTTETPDLDAELLLAYVLQKSRSYLFAWPDQVLTAAQLTQFKNTINRRGEGEPIAYIIGRKEFWSLPIQVTPDTLIPRPETELLVETVLKLASTRIECKVADVGTGSGAIALALAHERPTWHVVATDKSTAALAVARKNALQLQCLKIDFYQGDWCNALPYNDFDFIVSNPPYISEVEWETYAPGLKYEPQTALVSGSDGLQAIQLLIRTARSYLNTTGWLIIEHGFLQAESVRHLLKENGYHNVYSISDLAGHERVTVGSR